MTEQVLPRVLFLLICLHIQRFRNLVNLFFLTNLARISVFFLDFPSDRSSFSATLPKCIKHCDRWEKRGKPRNPH